MLDHVNVGRQPDADGRANEGAYYAQQKAITEEDFHDAEIGCPQRLENANVAGLLGHDHAENRQDAEAGHADDEKEQDIKNALFDINGAQDGALLLFPGENVHGRGFFGKDFFEPIAHYLCIAIIILELDLNAGHAILHGAQVLQIIERDEYAIGIVLAHLRFEIIDHEES